MKNTLLMQSLRVFAAAFTLSMAQLPAQAAPAASSAAQIPVQDFFRRPAASGPRLSPSGQKLALLIPTENGRFALAVADIATPTRFIGIARFDDADVADFGWVNDDRLWFDATDLQAELSDQLGSGLFAVNADGSAFTKIISRRTESKSGSADRNVLPGNRNRFLGIANDGSDDVFIQRYEWVAEDVPPDSKVLRLNTKTLDAKSIIPVGAPDGVSTWLLDRNREPRVAVSSDRKTKVIVRWRDPATNQWKQLTSYDAIEQESSAFTPVAVDADGQLFVTAIDPATMKGARTTALFRYNPETGTMSDKPIVNIKGFDFDGSVMFDNATNKALGVVFRSDASGAVWFDRALKADQEAIDKLLPGTVNALTCNRCSSARHLVVQAYSDRQSPVFFLYERASGKLTLIASSRPWLDSSKMAEQDFIRIKSRDGMEIPTVITRPQGKGPFPTVVLVHGGPNVRGEEWGFAADTQFLASRGYLVIQPEFRGSTGYGDTWFKAGWRQWGLTMQDDVTDVTKYAIAQGLADAKRIAIAGASYGGYATMMGLVKEPELYKAGINWVGVTDIGLMYDIGWSDFMGDKWMRYGMPRMIGDPAKDAAQLRATSPLQQAARIKQPVMMAYGVEDRRVPLPHGTKMRDALKAAGNTNVEWVTYEGEGHGWMLVKNNVDFWTRVENFLAKNLK